MRKLRPSTGRATSHTPQRVWQSWDEDPGLWTPLVWGSFYHSALLLLLHVYAGLSLAAVSKVAKVSQSSGDIQLLF